MKIAIYPGSFNPWHEGHEDVVKKAIQVFDIVYIAQGINPEKKIVDRERIPIEALIRLGKKVKTAAYQGLLVDFLKSNPGGIEFCAVIKGLRNGQDFEFEKTQQYWNEDLNIAIPTVYFISDRKLVHISSSAIRMVKQIKQ